MRAYNPDMKYVRHPLLGVCAIVVALTATAQAGGTVPGTTSQLSTAGATSTQTAPAISGTGVVWTHGSATPSGATNFDIFHLDLANPPARNLTQSPDEQEFLEDIDGSNLVFTYTSASTPGDIIVYDLLSGTPTPIATAQGGAHYEQPAIRGRYVVYVRSNGQSDIAGYDNAFGASLPQITNDAAVQARPRVSGDYVVYEDYGSGTADIHGYRISTNGPIFPIATGPAVQSMPDIDGDWVVWVASAGGSDQVMAYNLSSRVTTALTNVPSNKMQPRISGTRVVWADDRKKSWDVYTYDLATGREEIIADGPFDQMLADIDGSRVVYTSNESGFEQVYLFTISGAPPAPAMPFGCDPTQTDAFDAPVTMLRKIKRTEFASRSFTPIAGRALYACVENGKADGSERTDQLLLSVGSTLVLTPSDFKPSDNPPRFIAGLVTDGLTLPAGQKQTWTASLFGSRLPSTVTITLRIAK
jgi:TolB protein